MSVSDRLEKLNTVNASSMTLKVCVMMPFDRATQGKLHVFGCFLVSETGAYTMGEALVFGDTPEKRQPAPPRPAPPRPAPQTSIHPKNPGGAPLFPPKGYPMV